MSQPLFITLFCTLTLLIGTGIFFYWRYTYGVWATNRHARSSSHPNAPTDPTTITLDQSWSSSNLPSSAEKPPTPQPPSPPGPRPPTPPKGPP